MPDNDIRAKALDRLCQVKRALENAKAPFTAVTWEMLAEERRQPYRAAMEPYVDAIADLLAAPARVIETAEERDALPVGTIVVDLFEAGCTRVHRDPLIGWVRATSALRGRMGHQQHAPWLPATVLYEPEKVPAPHPAPVRPSTATPGGSGGDSNSIMRPENA